ncbi:MAG: VanZ family protein [Sulfuricella sp.]|nr:VanZ family protein [Sulfuricella sp.]
MLTRRAASSGVSPMLAAAYAVLIGYGSLYPFSDWLPAEDMLAFATAPWPRYITRSDVITNILVYLPLGLLLAHALRYRLRPAWSVLLATLLCLGLSFAMESLQALLPERVSSRLDLLMNGLGGLGGALLAGLLENPPGPLRRVLAQRRERLLPGLAIDLGLVALGLWALSQLTPLLLSLDTATLRRGLLPLWTPGFPSPFNWLLLAANFCAIAGLGLFVSVLARSGRSVALPFSAFVVAVLAVKIAVMGRYLALETGLGAALGLALAAALRSAPKPLRSVAGGLALLAGFALGELEPAVGVFFSPLEPFNWIPFRGQMHNLASYSEILSLFWPFLALGCLAAVATKAKRRRLAAFLGSLLVLAVMFGLEWQQQFIAGRHADVTDVLLALAGWVLPWWRRIHIPRGDFHGQLGRTHR